MFTTNVARNIPRMSNEIAVEAVFFCDAEIPHLSDDDEARACYPGGMN